MTEIKTRRQSVNFLGFLRGQLNGLQGIPTLCYELIQNADDVKDNNGNPGASKIIFDVCDDALYVYNDGVFRDIDFERMEKVSWGNKREEEGTTGAFGLGFISVYQVTDSPEIFSSGRHWQFVPNGQEDERIRETLIETKETKFRLPWAFEESEIRKELGILPISKEALSDYTVQINHAIESAALFLKQVTSLELRRNGKQIRRIETCREDNKLLLADGSQTIIWRIFEGRFDSSASEMRRKYGGIIENKRQSLIKIAVPDEPNVNGLLYAFLPSETTTGLPFHINADFYPSPDRKRIIFGDGFKAEWNSLAIKCAADTLANNFPEVLGIFSSQDFWEFADQIKKSSIKENLTIEFSQFWELLKPEIKIHKTVLTSSNQLVMPSDAVFLDTKELVAADKIFESLGIKTVHPDLRTRQNLLLETGVQNIRLTDISKMFVEKGLTERRELSSMPDGLRSYEEMEVLWGAIGNLWDRSYPTEKQQSKEMLKRISIAFGDDEALWPPNELFTADQRTRDFFSQFSSVAWYQEKSNCSNFLNELLPQFTLGDGLYLLKDSEDTIRELWENGLFVPLEMLEWLEKYRFEINQDIAQAIRELIIWPSADGELNPLTDLYLAGDFEDPLRLAKLVDLDALGGGRDFLERVLNVSQLDFITYVESWVPSLIQNNDLKLTDKFGLIRILAENLGKLRDRDDIQSILSKLPIVWCGGDDFFPASIAWFDSKEVKAVLGSEVKIAQLPIEKQDATKELYLWLGVSPEPEPKDIVKRIKEISESKPDQNSIQLIGSLIAFIASKWVFWNDEEKLPLEQLKRLNWLPGTKDESKWFSPPNVYSIYSSFLFDSQGNFLNVDRKIQQNANELFKFLEIESEPTPDLVVKHLLFSSQLHKPVTPQIYEYLNRNVEDPSISDLRGQKCLCLKDPEGNENYYSPDQVFWEQHPFGKYRFRLSPDYGRYKLLFDKIGVKDKPDVSDAIKVLLEIATKFGTSNLPLDDNHLEEEIIIMCWKLISESLENGIISKNEVKRKLGNQKTIPDSRKVLTKPELMFFEDRPGWGEKFIVVKNNLAPRIEGVWLGMEAAGVRPLSTVINTEMTNCENRSIDSNLLNLLHERKNLIRRVVEEHRSQGIKSLNVQDLERMTYYKADEIAIVRTFSGFGVQESSDREIVDSILFENCLYFSAPNGKYPWKGIARELSYVINPSGELRSLGMELKEILSQPLVEARKTLDELGYPTVEIVETNIEEGQTLVPGTDEGEIEGLRVGVNYPEAGKIEEPIPSSQTKQKGDNNETEIRKGLTSQTPTSPESLQEKRKSSRLRSYVYPEGTLSTNQEAENSSEKRTQLGQRGVDRVMKFELEQGRNPKDMELVQIHHPGYDIESKSKDGKTRYIEVKSLSGIWDSQNPAEVTKFEFETAKKKGEDFWLYVVEQVDSPNCRIFTIPDPANRVDFYLFDHGWLVNEKSKNIQEIT